MCIRDRSRISLQAFAPPDVVGLSRTCKAMYEDSRYAVAYAAHVNACLVQAELAYADAGTFNSIYVYDRTGEKWKEGGAFRRLWEVDN